MKESLRRIILFVVPVITGSVMILFEVPPVVMVPLLIIVGFAMLVALEAITIADLRDIANSLKPANLKKISIIKKLDEMKFFEKSAAPIPEKKKNPKPGKTPPAKDAEKKPGIAAHIGIFISSLGSLGSVLKSRTKSEKKVEDINKLLDKTVNEKVSGSALASAGNVAGTSRQSGLGGAGTGTVPVAEQDPFLSLSGDEFDAGLLDGLDELDSGAPLDVGMPDISGGLASTDQMASEPGIPTPSMDLSSEADEILKGNSTGLGEFSGLEGGDTIDQDFGDLDDLNLDDAGLDDVSLDDVSLDDELDGESGKNTDTIAEHSKEKTSPMPAGPAVKEIKTDWIKSDAPQGGEDQISTQADMAAFASGSGTDDDLLSSIASDVKHVKKEKDVSLLRELKDFKAPAEEIEQELNSVYERINAIPKPGKNIVQPEKEIK